MTADGLSVQRGRDVIEGDDGENLRAAADAYAAACQEYRAAQDAANAAYERYEIDPDSIEYVVEWTLARLREAEVASRRRRAEEALRAAR